MLRVLGGANDPASRIENRIGEPSANPYLYILSQIVAGLDGIDHSRDPGLPDTDPYTSNRAMLPKSLAEALSLMAKDTLFRSELGQTFVDYYVRLKQTEIGRFEKFVTENSLDPASEATTAWEQDEYFDFF